MVLLFGATALSLHSQHPLPVFSQSWPLYVCPNCSSVKCQTNSDSPWAVEPNKLFKSANPKGSRKCWINLPILLYISCPLQLATACCYPVSSCNLLCGPTWKCSLIWRSKQQSSDFHLSMYICVVSSHEKNLSCINHNTHFTVPPTEVGVHIHVPILC